MKGPTDPAAHGKFWSGIWIPAILVLLWSGVQWMRDPTFFWNDDFQAFYSPFYEEIVRAWRDGEWPLLSRNSWSSGNLAGEFQLGTFAPQFNLLLLAVWAFPLTLPMKAAVISVVHLAWLATGVFVLGRHRGLSVALATMAAVATTLSGWNIAWGATDWVPFLMGAAWLPWVWWALETSIVDDSVWRRWLRPALCVAFLITTGHTFGIAMIPIIAAWLAVRAIVRDQNWRALGPLTAGVALGIGLSAPAWWLLIEAATSSTRWGWWSVVHHGWLVPWRAWPGLVLPSFVVPWPDFFGIARPHASLELACGVVPAAALAAALFSRPLTMLRALRWELLLLAVSVILVSVPSFGTFRWSFRWLPLFHLVLALTAAAALQQGFARRAAASGVVLIAVVWAGAALFAENRSPWLAGSLLGLVVAWWLAERLVPRAWSDWLPTAVVVVSLGLTFWFLPTHQSIVKYSFDEKILDPAPLDPTRLYLSLFSFEEIGNARTRPAGFGKIVRPANAMHYAGLRFLNGYTSFDGREVKGLFDPHGNLQPDKARSLAGPDGERLLAFLGVDGLVASREYASFTDQLGPEWQKIADGPEGVAFHREPRRFTPVKVLTFLADRPGVPLADPVVEVIAERRNRVIVQVTPLPALTAVAVGPEDAQRAVAPIAFVRPFLAGYEAFLDGQRFPVRAYRNILPIVELPANAGGRLELRYRPRGLTGGLMLTGATAFLMLLIAVIGRWNRKPKSGN